MKKSNRFTAMLCAILLLMSGCGKNETENPAVENDITAAVSAENVTETAIIDSLNNGIVIDEVSGNVYKTERNANPISGSVFCADPTAVEYEGRLYVYGTNAHQQSELDTTNDYDQINSLVVFSTDDMVNWIYHGRIEVGEIAPLGKHFMGAVNRFKS